MSGDYPVGRSRQWHDQCSTGHKEGNVDSSAKDDYVQWVPAKSFKVASYVVKDEEEEEEVQDIHSLVMKVSWTWALMCFSVARRCITYGGSGNFAEIRKFEIERKTARGKVKQCL